jgi:hypothetical protein
MDDDQTLYLLKLGVSGWLYAYSLLRPNYRR